jgi:hypothetical protein
MLNGEDTKNSTPHSGIGLRHRIKLDVAPETFPKHASTRGRFRSLVAQVHRARLRRRKERANIQGDRPANSSDLVSTRSGDIMKSPLQEYESVTRQMIWISLALFVIGIVIYAMWFGAGALIAIIGFAGLVWCFMRR